MATIRTLLAFLGLLCISAQLPAATITISCGAVGAELALCRSGVENWAKKTGHQVRIVSTPNSSSERLALYQQLLAAGSSDIDIFQIDVIWPGILAPHLIDLQSYSRGVESRHFPAIVRNNTVNGRLIAMPWFTDAGLLYYRKDLLVKYSHPVPETWQQLTDTALQIQMAERAAGHGKMWGFVWQGRAYEGLTCNALEWFASQGGGRIISDDGTVDADNPQMRHALTLASSWPGHISPPGVLNYAEEEARGVFQSGYAVFMRSWPYAWALAQAENSAIRGKLGVAALPKGGKHGSHAATLGGWQLAVSRYSKHPQLSSDLVLYLTSDEEQKRRAIAGAYNPTIESLYQDPEILAVNPFFSDLFHTIRHAVPRPSTVTGTSYNRVSSLIWSAVHSALSGKRSPADALNKLQRDLERLQRRKQW
jgi:trehalose/maltose transport system substrate-binding protein